ncbi:MAG: hypothetical protein WDN08_14855 [Rhizomicrobium sp.]
MSAVLLARTEPDWTNKLADRMGAPTSELALTLAAEHIRASISAPSLRAFSAIDIHPVHTANVMASVRRNVSPWFSGVSQQLENDWPRLRESLETIGDVAHVGDGYWLPAPTRFIEVEGSKKCLLIGGSPYHSLFSQSRWELTSYVACRFVPREKVRQLECEIESLDSWLPPERELGKWLKDAFARLRRSLQPDHDVEIQHAEIYAPDLLRSQKKSGYWITPDDFNDPSQELRLFRSKPGKGWEFSRQYYVGAFARRQGVLTLSKSAKVNRDDAARIRFGWDLQCNACRKVVAKLSDRVFDIEMKFTLPVPESKILSLGWQRHSKEQVLRFEISALPFVRAAFARLHISIVERA